MALFGGSTPTFDVGPLKQLAQSGAARQKSIVQGLYSQLPGLNQQYGTSLNKAYETYAPAAEATAKAYSQGLEGLTASDTAARKAAIDAERKAAYTNLPEIQQTIRQSLGASGKLRTGYAGAALTATIAQAEERIGNLSSQLEAQGLDRISARREAGLQTLYSTNSGLALTKLGIDQNVASTLLQNGRQDLIAKAAALVGIDQNELNQMLGLEVTGQEANIAAAQSGNARRAALIKALGGIGGAAVGGATGGLPGAKVGLGVGSSVGDLFAGL